ncbi:hypothetical protein [Tritonibacter mobilis]|uniref:hypothetical protein n=1 Tax=Tritonibacter mobilis TaxID=379347 RepID=UPI000806C2EC|nr:hypothetical protein [Tritonibacter mobilis]
MELDADLDFAGEELQSRQLELSRIKADEKAHRSELDALMASAEKTRRHLAELDAKAVAAEKKEKRRRTYMARLAKKEAAIAAQKVALVQRTEAVEAAEAALAENTSGLRRESFPVYISRIARMPGAILNRSSSCPH